MKKIYGAFFLLLALLEDVPGALREAGAAYVEHDLGVAVPDEPVVGTEGPDGAAFDDADTNRDNLVSFAEVQVFAVKYRAERQRKRAAQADVASGNQVVKP